jgi:hypothetical protein
MDPLTQRMQFFQAAGDPPLAGHAPAVVRLAESGLGDDPKAQVLRADALAFLVHRFGAAAGVLVFDELSLLWAAPPVDHAGMLVSTVASTGTAFLAGELPAAAPELVGRQPCLAGVAFPVPSRYEAGNYVAWRARLAPKDIMPVFFRRVQESPGFFHQELRKAGSLTVGRTSIRRTDGLAFSAVTNKEQFLFEGADPK